MTRFWLGLALLVFAAGTASAEQVKSVEVYEFGTYIANGSHYSHAPSAQGIKIEGHDGYTHLETTRMITARIGARFGFDQAKEAYAHAWGPDSFAKTVIELV